MKMLTLTLILLCSGYNYCFNETASLTQTRPQDSLVRKLRKQKYLLEDGHLSKAWGYHLDGWYLDHNGRFYTYAYQFGEGPWYPRYNDSLSEQDLERKYSHHRKLKKKISRRDLLEVYRLIEQVNGGPYSEPVRRGFDAGKRAFSCYHYDEVTGNYREIELRVFGNWEYTNLSPEAQSLMLLLDSLDSSVKVSRRR